MPEIRICLFLQWSSFHVFPSNREIDGGMNRDAGGWTKRRKGKERQSEEPFCGDTHSVAAEYVFRCQIFLFP